MSCQLGVGRSDKATLALANPVNSFRLLALKPTRSSPALNGVGGNLVAVLGLALRAIGACAPRPGHRLGAVRQMRPAWAIGKSWVTPAPRALEGAVPESSARVRSRDLIAAISFCASCVADGVHQ